MRYLLILLFGFSIPSFVFSQDGKLGVLVSEINTMLPDLNSNARSKSIASKSQLKLDQEGYLTFSTSNSLKGKSYDQAIFKIHASSIDKDKIRIKDIECCNVLEIYCEDSSFDCVEYMDRTSRVSKPIPYILLAKDKASNDKLILKLRGLIAQVEKHKPDHLTKETMTEHVQLYPNGGVYMLNIKLGNKPYSAILDTGASVVAVSEKVEKELLASKTIAGQNYITPATYRVATGKRIRAKRFIIPSITVGSIKMENIICTVVDDSAPLLLGKSFLDNFSNWSINNDKQILTLNR